MWKLQLQGPRHRFSRDGHQVDEGQHSTSPSIAKTRIIGRRRSPSEPLGPRLSPQRRQKCRVNNTNTVKNSSRPSNMAKLSKDN